jgi:polysaccharide biosynthesis transport protein
VKWEDRNNREPLTSGVEHDAGIDFMRPFLAALWAEKRIILACMLLMSALGGLYLLQRPPSYTARGLLLVENTRLEAGRQELLPEVSTVDTSTVDSQVEIIRSEAVVLKAMEALKPAENGSPERAPALDILAHLYSMLPAFGSWGGDTTRISQESPSLTALPEFTSRLSVKRIGLSSVIEVGYKASNPERAAQVVNGIIAAYLADQAASAAAAAAAASAWLRDRIKDLGPRTRVISVANPPVQKDGPRRLFLFGAFSGIGLLLGIGIAVARYALDTTLRDPSKAKARLGVPFLGAVAKFSPSGRILKKAVWRTFRHVADLSGSDIAALVRRIRIAASACDAAPIIGVTSTTPGEGTTTLAAKLAFKAAAAGLRVLLVDGNTYEADLSSQLAPGAEKGLVDVLAGTASLQEVRLETRKVGLHFLPAGSAAPSHPGFGRSQVKAVVREWVDEYDLVIIDVPPLAPIPDLSLARNVVDTFVLVIEWGHVPAALAENALMAAGLTQKDMLGFVFNKVKQSAIDRFVFPLEDYRWKHAGKDYAGYTGDWERKETPPEGPLDLRRTLLGRTCETSAEYLALASQCEVQWVPRT